MNVKELLILNLPYLLFVYPFDKLSQAVRLAPGADFSAKLLSIGDGFTAAFSSLGLSFDPPCSGPHEGQKRKEIPPRHGIRQRPMGHGGRYRPLHG